MPVVGVDRVYPEQDAEGFSQWMAIWLATDLEKFPDEQGWDERDIRAMAADTSSGDFGLLLARDESGVAVGVAQMGLPQRDNRHASWLDVRVHPDYRRHGVGRALVAEAEARARAAGRSVINGISDRPVRDESHPSTPFAETMGFAVQHMGHRRTLTLPMDPEVVARLRGEVESARGAADYRMVRLRGLWPDEFIQDQCALERAMSTDQPLGDKLAEEEQWDAARIARVAESQAVQGLVSLVTAAQHIESGHLVAYSRICIAERRPEEAWQWATIVLHEHRGHRLGLAVKLANLEFLAQELATARRVVTSNAAVNAPMIAVNDMMGFEIDAVGAFWQKSLD